MSHESERERAKLASSAQWSSGCSCRPVNRAPFAGVCGSCGGVVEPGCACDAGPATRAPGHFSPKSDGACEALVSRYGDTCDYCRARCGRGAQ